MQLGEVTRQEFLQNINLNNAPANVGRQDDAGRVDSFLTSRDITTVCGPITDFTLITPVSSPSCSEKMVQSNYLCTKTYDTGRSFELIFMKFTSLMRVRS